MHKIEREEMLPNPFYKTSINLIPKPDKNAMKIKENYIQISFVNIGTKILKKIPVS
jgi:hypothetical protein